MAFPAPVSASPIAVLVDRDAIRAAVGRDMEADTALRMEEAAIIEDLLAGADADPPDEMPNVPTAVQAEVQSPLPRASRWHTVALAVALAASIVLMILAG